MPNVVRDRLIRRLRNLEFTRERMEELYDDDRIALRDLHSVYEGLFLRAVTGFEVFLEEQFIGILEGRIRYRGRGVARRMKVLSSGALMDILLQGDDYLDWLPFKKTEDRAKTFLVDGKPFCDITQGDRSTIKTITTIRHAIAHSGPHAIKKFHDTVIGQQALLPAERTPAGYLRSQFAGHGGNRFEAYVGELARIGGVIS